MTTMNLTLVSSAGLFALLVILVLWVLLSLLSKQQRQYQGSLDSILSISELSRQSQERRESSLSSLLTQTIRLLGTKDPIAYAQVVAAETESVSPEQMEMPLYRTDQQDAEEWLLAQGYRPDSAQGEELTGAESELFGEVYPGSF